MKSKPRGVAVLGSLLLHGGLCAGLAGLAVRGRPPEPVPVPGWGWIEAPAPVPAPIAAGRWVALPPGRADPTQGVRPVRVRARAAHGCCLARLPPVRLAGAGSAVPAVAALGAALAPGMAAPPPELARGIEAAIERAKFYPAMARRQHRQGAVQVGFDYLNGSVDHLRLLQVAGTAALDEAALLAVRTADYPRTPDGLVRTRFRLALWIRFVLAPGGVSG